MRESVIVGGARTAFGKFGGIFKNLSAVELGAEALRGAFARSSVSVREIDALMMGMVLQAGAGQNPARQAARRAGLSWSVPSETINKVCASGLRAITMADQIIRAGDADTIAAGGMESMSNAPYALGGARWGLRMGDAGLIDLLLQDGLQCAFANVHMAVHGSRIAAKYGITRKDQDRWALQSHQRALAAIRHGKLAEEIVGVTVTGREESKVVDRDEGPRADTDAEALARLKPVYDPQGTITAGNAPGVNDGAAALIVMSMEKARRDGYTPLATIKAHVCIGADAPYIAVAPALAITKLLRKTGLTLDRIKRLEVNEAFAAVVLTSGKLLGLDESKVNVNGGAIALGHPIGASGARILLTLIHELRRAGGGFGIAAICSGGAQGDAILIEVDPIPEAGDEK
jgi:acetyl-CoA C-acetyltransferase